MDQKKFYTIYRGKHSRLRYRSYMRLGKVYAALMLLERESISLTGISVLDYGFGAGAFFLHCDTDCALAGLELDAENVASVKMMLETRGYHAPALDVLDPIHAHAHPLLMKQYNLIVLSHVLEHLEAPHAVLSRLRRCIAPGGNLLGLLPLNERVSDENHKWTCHRERVDEWAAAAGCRVHAYVETDHVGYCIQQIMHAQGGLGRCVAQGAGLTVGLAASLFSPTAWFHFGRGLLTPLGAKASQAVFLLKI
jgi:SAM-dependent methyltransferase